MLCAWPLCIHMMDSGTPAAVAAVRPPMRQETPEKAEDWTPMVRSAAVTMEDTRAGVGVGSAATIHVLLGPRVSLGNSGGQTVQRLLCRPLQLVRGLVPVASMKSPSWKRGHARPRRAGVPPERGCWGPADAG